MTLTDALHFEHVHRGETVDVMNHIAHASYPVQRLVPDGCPEKRAVDAPLCICRRYELVSYAELVILLSLVLDRVHFVDQHEHPARTYTCSQNVELVFLMTATAT